jgi:hypothetical protein
MMDNLSISTALVIAGIVSVVTAVVSSVVTTAILKLEFRYLRTDLTKLEKRVDRIDAHLRPFDPHLIGE